MASVKGDAAGPLLHKTGSAEFIECEGDSNALVEFEGSDSGAELESGSGRIEEEAAIRTCRRYLGWAVINQLSRARW